MAKKTFEENMARLEVCCQKGLSERFDSSIGAATVLMPFSGTELDKAEQQVVRLMKGPDGAPIENEFASEE